MTRPTRIAAAILALALAVVAGWAALRFRRSAAAGAPGAGSVPAPAAPVASRGSAAAAPYTAPTPEPALPFASPGERSAVTVRGRVIDIQQQRPVAGVEVVFRGSAGETAATTGRDGDYAVRVAPGGYRAFVRDDTVMSIGRSEPRRLPGAAQVDTAGVPDQALMAAVDARRDVDGIDLSVVRGGVIAGRVVDGAGRPVIGAVIQATGGALRPTLASDVAESADGGRFELRLPPGVFDLVASHPRFAGISGDSRTRFAISPGDRVTARVALAAGCVITGRVVDRNGQPSGDGALERQWGTGDLEFAPTGQVDADGAFRWATTEEADVTLRAWPWKAPPSPSRRFHCRDGARFDSVVFQIPDRRPDLEGVLVDKAGRAVAFTYVDLRPLDPIGISQQERTDAAGRWQVYSMPPGRYRVIAQAEGRGVANTTVVSPRDGIRLELGGTGRLEGTTPRLASGSFELALERCADGGDLIPLSQSRRLVTVAGGRFTVDDLPACDLAFSAIWRGRVIAQHSAIPAGGAARVELALGELRDKTVHGVVRDAAGAALAGAVVSVVRDDEGPAPTTVADGAGGFTLKAFSGAALRAAARGKIGYASVGGADVESEQVDVVVDESPDSVRN